MNNDSQTQKLRRIFLNLSADSNTGSATVPGNGGGANGGTAGGSTSGVGGSSGSSGASVKAAEEAKMAVLKEKVALRSKMVNLVTSMAMKQVTNVKDAEMAASKKLGANKK